MHNRGRESLVNDRFHKSKLFVIGFRYNEIPDCKKRGVLQGRGGIARNRIDSRSSSTSSRSSNNRIDRAREGGFDISGIKFGLSFHLFAGALHVDLPAPSISQ